MKWKNSILYKYSVVILAHYAYSNIFNFSIFCDFTNFFFAIIFQFCVISRIFLSYYRRKRNIVPNHTIPTDAPRKKHPNGQYATNEISTTQYTWWNFLFKNLYQQFKRFANIYFLFIICLNFIPETEAIGKEVAM